VVTRVATNAESQPPHASDFLRADPKLPISRAAKNLALLLEDRAAAAHNPTYAKLLLEASRKAIEGERP